MNINTTLADYHNPTHAQHIVELLDHYAQDPMGGAEALTEATKQNLVAELSKRTFAFSVLAYCDGIPAGLLNAFEGFSTFACQPLVNIHDISVHQDFRGCGISHLLIAEAEKEAQRRGACKLTLEVLSNNQAACKSYQKYGFTPYELDPTVGTAQFWHKKVSI